MILPLKKKERITSKKGIIDYYGSCNDLIKQLNDAKKFSEKVGRFWYNEK